MTPIHELKKPFTCLQCESEIEVLGSVQNDRPVHKNQIVICWNCAALHKIGDGGLVKFTKSEFAKLDAQSKNLIAMTVTSILKRNARESNQ